MKKYLKPEMDVLKFNAVDVMAQSVPGTDSGSQYIPLPSPGGSMWYPPRP